MLLALAPMKDVTDLAFLNTLKDLNSLPDYFITEYFRTVAHHKKMSPYILRSIDENPTGRPIYGQLVGHEPEYLARDALEEKGVQIVDTTCGDVMKVWKRVKNYAAMGITSIIHGKATHEETSATASRALGERGRGKYLVVYDLEDARILCDYIMGRGDREAFLKRFEGCCSPGFDPDRDLEEVGIANQTTMLKTETQTLQKMVKDAIVQRDGDDDNFYVFDTICGATQDRQDALYELLKNPLDVMFVVGGYNSSNTTHLVDIAREHVPTYFIESAECIKSIQYVDAFDTKTREVRRMTTEPVVQNLGKSLKVGITAGASCPANLIEATILRIADLRK